MLPIVIECSLSSISVSARTKGRSIAGRIQSFDGSDFYETPAWATEKLLEHETFNGVVGEPCSGHGAIARVLEAAGCTVQASDLREGDRVYGESGVSVFSWQPNSVAHVITNPPYALAQEVVEKSLEIATHKVAMLLKLSFLESAKRHQFFKTTPLKKVYVFSNRVTMFPFGQPAPKNGGTIAYAWFVWERGYAGEPSIGWLA